MNKIKSFIGTRKFYWQVLMIALPIMAQNVLTNFVGLLDNIMLGQIGTEAMSAAAICNQLIFVYSMSMNGILAGAGIFTTQYFGKKDDKGISYTFRFKIITVLLMTLIIIGIFATKKTLLIGNFLHEGGQSGNLTLTQESAFQYLNIMLMGLIPFCISQACASTLRETGEVKLPMVAGLLAVLTNVVGNYLLIFGKFGCPRLGIGGAAVATVISRFVECMIIVLWTLKHSQRHSFIKLNHRFMLIPKHLVRQMLFTSMPILVSSFLWSSGVTFMVQCFSTRGLAAMAAYNIASTINNVFANIFGALSTALIIIVGQLIGADKMQEAKETNTKVIVFSVTCCIAIGLMMAVAAPFFLILYQTSDEIKRLSVQIIWIMASVFPVCAFTNAAGGTIRCGGKTGTALFIEIGYTWGICAPIAFLLSRFTRLPIIPLYFLCQYLELFKALILYYIVRKGSWLQKVISD